MTGLKPFAGGLRGSMSQGFVDGRVGQPAPPFPVLRIGEIEILTSETPEGSATWDSPPGLEAGDLVVAIVAAGPNSPSISPDAGWTEIGTLTTMQGVTATAFWFEFPGGSITQGFAFPDDNCWVMHVAAFAAGSFDAAQAPTATGALTGGPDPNPPEHPFEWTGKTFALCAFASIAGVDPTAYPLTDNNDYQESVGGEAGGVPDVGAAICSTLIEGDVLSPGPFSWAGTDEAATFTLAIKGVSP